MMRRSATVVTMSMLAACGGLAYLHATREQVPAGPVRSSEAIPGKPMTGEAATVAAAPQASTIVTSTEAATHTAPLSESVAGSETAATPPEDAAQWIRNTESPDAKVRAAAIAALANAPKTQAMPALERVLEIGEPNVDRHIALRSMHSLALRDGDRDGQIRDVIRGAIYHGDDEGVSQTAQSLLDDIEAEFTERELDTQR